MSSPIVENKIHDVNLNIADSCNSKCCLPLSPRPKRDKTDKKVKESKCNII